MNILQNTIEDGVLIRWRCTEDTVLPDGIREIAPNACQDGYVVDLEIPNGVEVIGDYAFAGHWELNYVTIPPTVRKIGKDPFEDCSEDDVLTITVYKGSYAEKWASKYGGYVMVEPWEDGPTAYTLSGEEAVLAPGFSLVPNHAIAPEDAARVRSIVIPDGVTEIKPDAFVDCPALERVVLPYTLKAVRGLSFHPDAVLRELVIPEGVESVRLNWAGIGNLNYNQYRIEKLRIPGTVKTIGKRAFAHCGIRELELAYGIESIADFAFAGNPLREVRVPASVRQVGDQAFQDENGEPIPYEISEDDPPLYTFIGPETVFTAGISLVPDHAILPEDAARVRSVVIPDGVTEIKPDAFVDCPALERLVLPPSVKAVAGFRLHPDAVLRELVIPEGVESVCVRSGDAEDSGRYELGKLRLPGTVKTIREWAFARCGIRELELAEGIEIIEDHAFEGNPIDKLRFPGTVKTIREWAFARCGIRELELAEGIEIIEDHAFAGNPLWGVRLPASLKQVGDQAFLDENMEPVAIKRLEYTLKGGEAVFSPGIRQISDHAILPGDAAMIRSVEIPDSVTEIRPDAFVDCPGLERVVLPASLRWFWGLHLHPDAVLRELVIPGAGPVGYTLNGDEAVLSPGIRMVPGRAIAPEDAAKVRSIVIPDGVTEIHWGAFIDCPGLERVVLPPSLKVFEGIKLHPRAVLRELEIPEGVESVRLNRHGIGNLNYNQYWIKKLRIPGTVKTIKDSAFAYCGIRELELAEGIEIIENFAFEGNPLQEVRLPGSMRQVGEFAFMNKHGKPVTILHPQEYTLKGGEAVFSPGPRFLPAHVILPEDAAKVRAIVLPDGLEIIHPDAFVDCPALERVVLPPSLKVFEGIKLHPRAVLRELEIPEGVESVRLNWPGIGCMNYDQYRIEKLRIPGTVKTIKDSAFAYCGIRELELAEGIETIEGSAFAWNPLREVRLPASAKRVYPFAFLDENWQPVTINRPEFTPKAEPEGGSPASRHLRKLGEKMRLWMKHGRRSR